MCMDARLLTAASTVCLLFANSVTAGSYQTANFTVQAPSDDIARKVGDAAEFWRKELAQLWLNQTLPDWGSRCPISVKVGQ
ncbi:MAG: hypothetical protein KDA58_10005, partial [Planctomycetaceae bacterium]|nr:hypothetical protein [Planctomycetaceae bacterium]